MEFLFHHLIGRYVINLPAIGCLVVGGFSVGVAALFLPVNVPSDRLIVAIIPAGAACAAFAEAFRIRARLFVKVPFTWVGSAVLTWLSYSVWSFNGLTLSVLVILIFSGIIFGLSLLMDVWEWDKAENLFRRLIKCSVKSDQVETWREAASAWASPRISHRSPNAARHNADLLRWILKNLGVFMNDSEIDSFAEILSRLALEQPQRKLRDANLKCGAAFFASIDAHVQRVFGKRLHRSFQITPPN